MIISYCTIFVFVLLINTEGTAEVTLQAEGNVGRSVVLQCSSSDIETKLLDINVRWRYNDSLNVFDIIKGKSSVEHQDPNYKNRVDTFPELYKEGHFSLTLDNLKHTDAGEYQCFITHSSELVKVQLRIKESAEKKGDQAAVTRLMWIPVLCVFLLLVSFLFVIYILKKYFKTSSSGVPASGGCLISRA